jgi:2'-5' RNA ligase
MDPNQAANGRVFIALWPPETVAARITRDTLASVRASGGRPVRALDLHLTLAFLGRLTASQLDAAAAALGATDHAAFQLSLDRLGFFRRAQVLWLAPSQPPAALADVHSALWAELAAAGFTPERRAFKAHLTLARRGRPVRPRTLASPIDWQVDSLVLATSGSGGRGNLPDDASGEQPARYRRLGIKALAP